MPQLACPVPMPRAGLIKGGYCHTFCLLPLSLYGARGREAAFHYTHLSPSLHALVLIGLTWTPRFDWLPYICLCPLFHPHVSIVVISVSPVQMLSVFCSYPWLLNVTPFTCFSSPASILTLRALHTWIVQYLHIIIFKFFKLCQVCCWSLLDSNFLVLQ
jgi:hypothetical protein